MVPDKFWQIPGSLCVLVGAYKNYEYLIEGHNPVKLFILIQCDFIMVLSAHHATWANPTNPRPQPVSVNRKAPKTEQTEILLFPVFLCIRGTSINYMSFLWYNKRAKTNNFGWFSLYLFLCLNYSLVNFVFLKVASNSWLQNFAFT